MVRDQREIAENERLVRQARISIGAKPTSTWFGVPDAFAAFLGLHPYEDCCQRQAKLTGQSLRGAACGRFAIHSSSMRLSCNSRNSQPHALAAWTCSLNRCT